MRSRAIAAEKELIDLFYGGRCSVGGGGVCVCVWGGGCSLGEGGALWGRGVLFGGERCSASSNDYMSSTLSCVRLTRVCHQTFKIQE